MATGLQFLANTVIKICPPAELRAGLNYYKILFSHVHPLVRVKHIKKNSAESASTHNLLSICLVSLAFSFVL